MRRRELVPLVPARPRGRRAEDARVGGGDHGDSGGDDPATGPGVRHVEAGGAAVRLRPGANGLRRAVPPRRLRARRHHRQRGHRGRQLRHEQRRHRTLRHQEPAGGSQPDRRARVLAAARRPPDPGQGGRLSRRHQDDLLGGGRPLQPVPQREQDRRGPGRHRVLRGPGPLPHPDRPLRRHRAARHDLLGAQRRAHAVGGRRPLRDLHEAGHRADVRVPERHRHLRRPRPPRRHRRPTTTRRRSSGCAS